MSDHELGRRLSECAQELANATITTFRGGAGIHPPTAIAACARMAGTSLLRSFGLPLDGVAPGTAVLSEDANAHAPMLLAVAANILAKLGVALPESPAGPLVDPRTRPKLAFLETQRRLEPVFRPICAKHGLDARQSAQAAAVATAFLVHHFVKHVPPVTAFGLAAYSFVEGSKTAPDPVRFDDASRAA